MARRLHFRWRHVAEHRGRGRPRPIWLPHRERMFVEGSLACGAVHAERAVPALVVPGRCWPRHRRETWNSVTDPAVHDEGLVRGAATKLLLPSCLPWNLARLRLRRWHALRWAVLHVMSTVGADEAISTIVAPSKWRGRILNRCQRCKTALRQRAMQHHVEGVRWAMSSNWKVVISKRRGDCHRASLARPPIDAALNMNAFWLAQDTCLEGAEGLDTKEATALMIEDRLFSSTKSCTRDADGCRHDLFEVHLKETDMNKKVILFSLACLCPSLRT